jgi:hypothetical protein
MGKNDMNRKPEDRERRKEGRDNRKKNINRNLEAKKGGKK